MKFFKILLITALAATLLFGCKKHAEPEPQAIDPPPAEADETIPEQLQIIPTAKAEYTFIWMSDTQHYCADDPRIFNSMTAWIAANIEALNIKYVFHTGDLVQNRTNPEEWDIADTAFKALDNKVPYIIAAGNHDVGNNDFDYEYYLERFPPERFSGISVSGGSYKHGKASYDIVHIDGTDYIFLAIGWGCYTDKCIEWANSVLQQHSEKNAILLVHNYITTEGLLSDVGEILFEQVVKPNPNVFLVLCGHRYNSVLLTCDIDEDGDNLTDRTVYQKMGNYQAFERGGNGYLNIITVNSSESTIKIEAYSPYLDDYHYFDPRNHINKDSVLLPVDIFH